MLMVYELLRSMFRYDLKKRLSVGEVLRYGYFIEEELEVR